MLFGVKRIVIDTAVVVTAFRSRKGAGQALLRAVAMGRFVPLATVSLFLEYESVLKRPEHLLATEFSLDDVEGILGELAALIEPVAVHFLWRPQLADPADEMVLEAAVNGQADALVTYNVRDFGAASRFGLPVLLPGDLLRMGTS